MTPKIDPQNQISATEMEYFNSPTLGRISFENLVQEIVRYIGEDPKQQYQVVVGTDSPGTAMADFVTAIVVRKIGHGGRYWWHRSEPKKFYQRFTRERIYLEVSRSINVALLLTERLKKHLEISQIVKKEGEVSVSYHLSIAFEVHVDLGENGATKDMIKEVLGMVRGYGFDAKTKPESYGASAIADRHT
ncbi:hypothetical protein C4553_02870 [Candidatus Parcubacteria bacterium]|nr:MAG: hypothetical protein C4553_02870 [Candidatus Parcubacteria bacterium]